MTVTYLRSLITPSSRDTAAQVSREDGFVFMMFLVVSFFVIMLSYWILNLGLHAAAYHAANEWKPDCAE
jgi:hypothetical protein